MLEIYGNNFCLSSPTVKESKEGVWIHSACTYEITIKVILFISLTLFFFYGVWVLLNHIVLPSSAWDIWPLWLEWIMFMCLCSVIAQRGTYLALWDFWLPKLGLVSQLFCVGDLIRVSCYCHCHSRISSQLCINQILGEVSWKSQGKAYFYHFTCTKITEQCFAWGRNWVEITVSWLL